MERAPIHWAIIHKNADIVSLLIDAKCDIETADKVIKTKEKDIKFDHNVFFKQFGMKPILMAAMVGNLDIVKMLINAGCDCRAVNKVSIWVFSWKVSL